MTAAIPVLLFVSTVAAGFAPQRAVQGTNQPKVGSRVPVDVSVRGGGRLGLLAAPTTGSTTPFDCAQRIADQLTGRCLTASSTPTSGVLFPYPGVGNVFTPPAFVGGGRYNQATGSLSVVGGGRYNGATATRTTVGGGFNNNASGPFATVAGGLSNTASGYYGAAGGGAANMVPGYAATVAGGLLNTASGRYATVGGGGGFDLYYGPYGNTASGDYATVAGGRGNTASGRWATVAGGYRNAAVGDHAIVAGGDASLARGRDSFAAGRRARANHDGAFVWADGMFTNGKTSSATHEFNVYCSGGARFFSNSAATTGVLLAAGGGSWSSVSDRDSKENVEPVDGRQVLEQLAALPLATWNYKAQDDSIRHMGPMAQDFHEAFGLGVSDKLIDTIDPDGVALAAIQGLNALVQDNEMRLAEKDAEIEELHARVERLEALAQAALAK